MLGRRGFLQAMGMAPVAGPALAKQALETATADMAGLSIGVQNAAASAIARVSPPNHPAPQALFSDAKAMQAGLRVPGLREEIISMFYESNRAINRIDPDIAVHRSFSLAAKVAYQRQRDVEAAMHQWCSDENWHSRLYGIFKRVMGPF